MSTEITITRKFEWDAAHRVMRHESKCSTLHGHHYVALLTITAPRLDALGRVLDFSVVKEKVGGWIDDHFDHTTIVNEEDEDLLEFVKRDHANGKREPFVFHGEPTAEHIASFLVQQASIILWTVDLDIRVVSVEVFETPNCSAKATAVTR